MPPRFGSDFFRTAIAPAFLVVALSACALSACSTQGGEGGDESCPDGQERNPLTDECRSPRQAPSTDTDFGTDATDDSTSDTIGGDTSAEADSDANTDTAGPDGDETDSGACDRDGDGVRDEECGGPDCDSSNPGVHPDAPELCDDIDNNCNGEINEGIDCSFYAHSQSTLYRIDPFEPSIRRREATNAPTSDFLDMDTHPNGDLWAIAGTDLYRLEEGTDAWQNEGTVQMSFGANFNGMAIDRQGVAFLTAGNSLYKLDLNDTGGTLEPTKVGDMGGDYRSSGDCVINKKGSLLMTSSNTTVSGPDILVSLDSANADAAEIGETDHDAIWGLTAAWGRLFGTTEAGELVVIETADGSSRTLETFDDKSFYGAASTPASRRSSQN